MKIAVPLARSLGWNSPVSNHFGHAPFFAIVDYGTGKMHILEAVLVREASECAPLRALHKEGCGN